MSDTASSPEATFSALPFDKQHVLHQSLFSFLIPSRSTVPLDFDLWDRNVPHAVVSDTGLDSWMDDASMPGLMTPALSDGDEFQKRKTVTIFKGSCRGFDLNIFLDDDDDHPKASFWIIWDFDSNFTGWKLDYKTSMPHAIIFLNLIG
jgi:hypothetical protein